VVFRGVGREHELIVEEMQRLELRVLDRQRDEDQVEDAAGELVNQGFGDGLTELQVELGEAPLQLRQRIGP
jgi:hypothetical protein